MAHALSAASLIALVFLCLAWELWLAPLRPGGSWLVLKAVPLLTPLRGVLHGRVYTLQWASMLILAYFAEGLVRGPAEHGTGAWLAWGETALATVFFASAITYIRASRKDRA